MTALLVVGGIAVILGLLWHLEIKAHARLVEEITKGQEDR